MKTAFVILHYLTEKVTASSIDALLRVCDGFDAGIVVVDNASPNGSGHRLADRYKRHDNVHFILMPENAGFARGNNAGYRYAVDRFSPDFVVVMNNDVIIDDSTFIPKIEREYEASPFAVLGPDIFCPSTGKHQNPAHLSGFTEKEVEELRAKLSSQLKHFCFKRLCWKAKLLLGLAHAPVQTRDEQELYTCGHAGCVLHGACYVFSKDFLCRRDCAFNPGTFLYFEEDILHYECLRDGLSMRYTPDIRVVHLEDAATKKAVRTDIAREKRKKERMVQSIDVILKIMQDDSK